MPSSQRRSVLLVLLTVLGLLTIPAVAAQGTVDCGDDAVTTVVTTYNANLQDAPDIVSDLFGGKTTELRIGPGSTMPTATTGEAYHFTLTNEGAVTDCAAGDADSPAIRVRMSNETLTSVATADDPGAAFEQAYNDGDIRVSGVGLTNAVLMELVRFGSWLAGLF